MNKLKETSAPWEPKGSDLQDASPHSAAGSSAGIVAQNPNPVNNKELEKTPDMNFDDLDIEGDVRDQFSLKSVAEAAGYYRYRTNPNPDTVPWIITGAMKVSRILDDAETEAILRENGIEPM